MKTKSLKKIVSFIVAVSLVITLFAGAPTGVFDITASAETANGTTGVCDWTVKDDTIVISGGGNMGDNLYKSLGSACNEITTVIVENGVTSIGDSAFRGCSKIVNVTLPLSITSIGDYAFYGCSELKSIVMLENVESIGNYAFYNCSALTDITIPDSVKSIGDYAFYFSGFYMNENNRINGSLYINNHLINVKPDAVSGSYEVLPGTKSIAESAFARCEGITDITIPDSVVGIGNSAFYDCKGLVNINVTDNNNDYCSVDGVLYNKDKTVLIKCGASKTGEVIMPDSVTEIKALGFSDCTGIKSVKITNNVWNIGSLAFAECKGLESLTIPDGIIRIGKDAFRNCNIKELIIDDGSKTVTSTMVVCKDTLEKLTIPDSVASIADGAISGLSQLSEINLGEGNKNYCLIDGVLYDIEKEKIICCPINKTGKVTIPDTVKAIPSGTFSNCEKITSVEIPDSVTEIASDAFSGCKEIKELIIADGSKTITAKMIICKDTVEKITIPDSVTSIESSAFTDCVKLSEINVKDNNTTYCSKDGVLYNKDMTELIKCPAYMGKTEKFKIPDSVTSINDYAFEGCTEITNIIIPSGINKIGNSAFAGCEKIVETEIPNTVTVIGNNTFSGCKKLKNIKIPDTVTVISDNAFKDCSSLEGITIPSGTTTIGANAFTGCAALTAVSVPDAVTKIGKGAFGGCAKLATVTMSGNIEDIGADAFKNCPVSELIITGTPEALTADMIICRNTLEKVTIPDGVKTIDKEAFKQCYSLKTVTLPNSVTTIGESAFLSCVSLTDVNIPTGVTEIPPYAFYGCAKIADIDIPSTVTELGDYSFYGCTGLTEVTIPSGVKNITSHVFSKCVNIVKITIPDSVNSIGVAAFEGCSPLLTITAAENSAAHKYAVVNNIKYELIKPVTVESEDKNITISTDSSVIPSEGVSLSTEKIENIDEKYEAELKNLGAEKFAAYNIDLMKAGAKIQPDGKVTVSIAVPDGMDGAKCKVYRAESDGTLTDMKAGLNDGKLTFTTDHFSLYIITQSAVKLGDVDGDGGVTIKDAIAILRHNAEVELLTGSQIIAGDLNGDGSVNTKDAILILQYDAQIIEKFPIE